MSAHQPIDRNERPMITDALVDAVADAVDADSRSVVRRLAGLPVRGRRGEAIDRELSRRGLLKFAIGAE